MANRAHERYLDILITCDESDDSVLITALRWYRNESERTAGNYLEIEAAFSAASATRATATLSSQHLSVPTIIGIIPTFQA